MKVSSFVVCVWPVALTFELYRSICPVVREQRQRRVDCLYFKYWFMCSSVLVLFLRNLNLTFCLYRLSLSVIPLRWCGIGRSTLANALWLMGRNWETSMLRGMETVAWDNCHHLLLQTQTPKRSSNWKNHNHSMNFGQFYGTFYVVAGNFSGPKL